jgi:hypothetical protein
LRQERTFGEILVRKHTDFDQLLSAPATVRDDWR